MIENWGKLPVFKKAMDIQKLVDYIVESVEKTDINFEHDIEAEMLKSNISFMRENAMIISAKITGVAAKDTIYGLRMENAAIIRKSARNL